MILADASQVAAARLAAQRMAQQFGFDETRVGRVAIVTGKGGRRGVRLQFVDRGPGIADLDLALKDGYTTGGGLGLGLSGAKRLSDEFELRSRPGEGTRVTILRWKPF